MERVGYLRKLLEGSRWGQPIGLKDRFVVPQHVGAVDVGRDAPVVILVFEQCQQVGREGFLQPFGGVDVVNRLQVCLGAVGLDLQAGVELEGVGRVATQQAGLVHGLEVGARAAGHGGVHDLNVRVLPLIDAEHTGQALGFAAGRPPATYH